MTPLEVASSLPTPHYEILHTFLYKGFETAFSEEETIFEEGAIKNRKILRRRGT